MPNGFDGVGKTSTTGNASGADSGQQDPPQIGVGKSSLVHDTHGVQPSNSLKRPASEGGDGGGGGGGGGDGGGDAKRRRRDAFRYRVVPGAVGSFEADTSPPVHSAVTQSAQPLGQAKGTAYVGNVITVGSGKDKTPAKVADQYAAEAFDNPTEASKRFALVVGVNRRERATDAPGAVAAELHAQINQIASYATFPVTAFRRVWSAPWVDENNTPVSLDDVRNQARAHEVDLSTLERQEHGAGALPPVGPMRTAVIQHPATSGYLKMLGERYERVYAHVGDADAVNLKAKTEPTADAAHGLFDRYDTVLADAKRDGKDPKLLSGGYRFGTDNRYLPEAARPEDPHAGSAGKVSPQTAASAEYDMRVRSGLSKQGAAGVYLPEPNLLIRSDAITAPTAEHPGTHFGETNKDESLALVKSMTPDGKKPTNAWAKQNMLLDDRAALVTDGGRFNDPMVHLGEADKQDPVGDQYAGGATDTAGLMHPDRNPQSHGRKRELGNAIAHMNRNISDILDSYLPLQLLRAKEEQQSGKVSKQTLDRVRDYLKTYQTIVNGMTEQLQAVMADSSIKIPALTSSAKKANAKKDPMNLNAQEAEGAKAIHDNMSEDMKAFASAAFPDSPDTLSKKMIKAVAAMKAAAKDNAQPLAEILPMCQQVAIDTAHWLATFDPQAALIAQPQATPVQLPPSSQLQQISLHDPSNLPGGGGDAMQVD